MSSSRYTFVALFLIASAILTTLVLDRSFAGLLAVADVANTNILGERFTLSTLIGLALSVAGAGYAWTNKRTKEFCAECIDELGKVSWPEASETKMNTIVVIVFSFIAAGILGVFDSVFGWLTRNNLFLF
jgi:preprotein translocase subunit SecE